MINQTQKNVLMLALLAGEILLKSGSEIYRVEDTVVKICKAFRIPYAEVFATTTGIFLSLDAGEDAFPHTLIRRIKGGRIDLGKISAINSFSRELDDANVPTEKHLSYLNDIKDAPPYRLPMQILGAAMITSFFTLMLGGVWQDFGCALVSGVCTYGFALFLDHLKLNSYIRYFFACALTA
ncbi:MAG: threonine/serine exporter family protein, partial [Eubacteriales bacterium]|nr:threonine/serine exporter family protein [Eubacteriales bacterium]